MDNEQIMRIQLRRRLNVEVLKNELDYLLEESEPCGYSNSGDFISEYCDILKDIVLDYTDIEVSPKSKDQIYFYMVDNFGSYLDEIYRNECSGKKNRRWFK